MPRLPLLLPLLLLACSCAPDPKTPEGTLPRYESFIDEQLELTPSLGREAGLHAWDGKIADYSRIGIEARIKKLEKRRGSLLKQRARSANEEVDINLVLWDADQQLFWLVDRPEWRENPAFYSELFAVNDYLDRPYAPLEERVSGLVLHEEAALRQVAHVRANLNPKLAKPLVDVAIGIFEGYGTYLRTEVPTAVAAVKDAPLKARFERANAALASEADSLAAWLKSVPTDDSHILGRERFELLVQIYAGEKLPLADFQRIGEADLAKNRAAYEALATSVKPARPADALPVAQALAEEARAFLIARQIVTLPSDERARVTETPPYMRYNYAWLSQGGPYEPPLGASFYITPPDPSWPEEKRASYVATYGELRSTTVHEVYPGHFVQALWTRKAPTRAQKIFGSPTFSEGWAHYAEQMMIEEGFGTDGEAKLGQLSDALLRNCRYLVALGVHAGGMTMEQAEERFVNDCHQTRATAKEQSLRAAFHPWYFAYTLGKLQVLALRDEAKRQMGPRFSLRRFHDALLAHGQPPVGLLRKPTLTALRD